MTYWRRIRSRFGSHATAVKITREAPWYWRYAVYSALILTCVVAGVWLFQHGQVVGERRAIATMGEMAEARIQFATLTLKLAQAQQEIDTLKAALIKANSEIQMSHSSQADLTSALTQLQEQHGRLNEELAFLHKVTAGDLGQTGLKLSNFVVEPDVAPNAYRYHALLVLSGKSDREFQGNAELQIRIERNSQTKGSAVAELAPQKNIVQDIKFKYYQRLEGHFKVVAGAVVKSAQLKIFEKDSAAPRVTETTYL